MKVSILTVTQPSRVAFWPWLVKMVSRFELPPGGHEWLISVPDMGSRWEDPLCQLLEAHEDLNWTVIGSDKKTLGERRQELLDRATGDIIAWVDDDDWHHPARIAQALAEMQRADERYVFFDDNHAVADFLIAVDLVTGRGVPIDAAPAPMSFVGPVGFARKGWFPAIDNGEDAAWFAQINKWQGESTHEYPIAALCHGQNTTAAQQRSWRFHLDPSQVAELLGPQWVADQPDLAALRARLKQP